MAATCQTLFALLVLLSSIAVTAPSTADELGIESKIRAIKTEYNVQVHHIYDAKAYFPPRWLAAPILARAKQLPAHETARLLPVIDDFLSVYPKRVLNDNLVAIYLMAELSFYGKSFGATNSKSSLYIRSDGAGKGYTSAFVFSRMHSEFSSILMRNHAFPENDWRSANSASFKYVGSGTQFLGRPDLYGQNPELLTSGFIVKYAQSSMENDFNMISDWLFTRRNELKQLARQYRRIESKRQLAIKFYKSIDEGFDLY